MVWEPVYPMAQWVMTMTGSTQPTLRRWRHSWIIHGWNGACLPGYGFVFCNGVEWNGTGYEIRPGMVLGFSEVKWNGLVLELGPLLALDMVSGFWFLLWIGMEWVWF